VGKKSASKPATVLQFRVYVKRGAQRRYDQIKRESADLPVIVQWDRRVADRREPTEAPGADEVGLTPRTSDRRKAPTFNFQKTDFVVVQEPDEEA
jgi:hypothetical protein